MTSQELNQLRRQLGIRRRRAKLMGRILIEAVLFILVTALAFVIIHNQHEPIFPLPARLLTNGRLLRLASALVLPTVQPKDWMPRPARRYTHATPYSPPTHAPQVPAKVPATMAGFEKPGDIVLAGLDWSLIIDGQTGEFYYNGDFDSMLREFWSLALGGSGAFQSACRSFLGVQDKDEFLKIDGTTLSIQLTTGPYQATFDKTGLLDIKGEASARMELVLQKLGDVLAERCQ